VIFVSPSGRVATGFSPLANSVDYGTDYGVPGLGFDYVHLAAISRGLQNGSSFRSGRHGHRSDGTFVPILFGGYPYYYDDQGYDPSTQPAQPQQPQIIVIQQPVPAQAGGPDLPADATKPAAQEAQEPVRDVGEFILVRRDGRILFASMFSVVGTQLRYVTPEGIRHTLEMADLDADATQQMNEARGTTIQIHN